MKNIILASASPRRRDILTQAGIPFTVCVSQAEEVIDTRDPAKAVKKLSALKCREVFDRTPGDVAVIGADTVVVYEGEIYGKPGSPEEAARMLEKFQGNRHQVYTGVTVCIREKEEEKTRTFHETTEVVFYPMTKEEIQSYIATGEPEDKAGAYGIQGKAVVFIKEIHGDYSNMVGLPAARLYQELKEMGIDIREWQI